MKLVDLNALKEIVKDVIGANASHTLLANVYRILEAEVKDQASGKEACAKIEKMVGLFIGADKAQALGKRLSQAMN